MYNFFWNLVANLKIYENQPILSFLLINLIIQKFRGGGYPQTPLCYYATDSNSYILYRSTV